MVATVWYTCDVVLMEYEVPQFDPVNNGVWQLACTTQASKI